MAQSPWHSAGPGYVIRAETLGARCGEATLVLTVSGPDSVILYRLETGAAAIRTLYGVPGWREMQAELTALIAQAGPQRSDDLPPWPAGESAPDGFTPDAALDHASYEALRKRDLALFCHADAPRAQTCLILMTPMEVRKIGRRHTG